MNGAGLPREPQRATPSSTSGWWRNGSVCDFLRIHAGIRHPQGAETDELVGRTLAFANQLTGEPVPRDCRMTELSGGQTRALLILYRGLLDPCLLRPCCRRECAAAVATYQWLSTVPSDRPVDDALTPQTAKNYLRALPLEGEDAAYFVDLVAFNQAVSGPERDAAYQRLTGHKGYRKAHTLDARHAAYHSKWYIPAIRELAMRSDFEGDPKWIASRLDPPISVKAAARALDVLLELQLLSKGEDGSWAVSDWVLTTPDVTRGDHLRGHHRVMLAKASHALDALPAADRKLSAVTFCVNPEAFGRIVERVKRFRQELVSMASLEDEGSMALHVGIQVFRLARDPREVRT